MFLDPKSGRVFIVWRVAILIWMLIPSSTQKRSQSSSKKKKKWKNFQTIDAAKTPNSLAIIF